METVHKKVFTLPNFITGIGLVGIAAYVASFLTDTHTLWIPVLIFFISLSDALDGWAARKFNQHTYFGKVLDPLRDRLIALAVFINILYVAGSTPVYVLMALVLFFELGITALNYFRVKKAGYRNKAHLVGKLRMLVHNGVGGMFVLKVYWADILEGTPLSWISGFSTFSFVYTMTLASIVTFCIYLTMNTDNGTQD